MIGFTGQFITKSSTTTTCTTTPSEGYGCVSQNIQYEADRSRNFFQLLDLLNDWTSLYISQRTVQIAVPYAYMALLESASVMALSLLAVLCIS